MIRFSAWHRPAESLLDRAVDFLRDTGLAICEEEGIDLLDTAGAILNRNEDFVRLRPPALRRVLGNLAGAFNLCDREGHKVGTIAGGLPPSRTGCLQATVANADRVLTSAGDRPQTLEAGQLPDVAADLAGVEGFQILGCAPRPDNLPPALGDLYRLYLGFVASRHPQLLRPRDATFLDAAGHMLSALRGSRDAAETKPLIIIEAAPPRPAQIDQQTGRLLIDCARKGIPVAILPPPRAGSSEGGPRTRPDRWALESAVVALAATLIHQTARRHAPLLWGMPFVQPWHTAAPWREAWRAALTVGDLVGLPTLCTLCAPNERAAGAPVWALEAATCRARVIAWGGAGPDAACLYLTRLAEHGAQAEEVARAVALLSSDRSARAIPSVASPLDSSRQERLAEIVRREAERFDVADLPGVPEAS